MYLPEGSRNTVSSIVLVIRKLTLQCVRVVSSKCHKTEMTTQATNETSGKLQIHMAKASKDTDKTGDGRRLLLAILQALCALHLASVLNYNILISYAIMSVPP